MPKNLFKRRVYWLVLKTSRLFPIPTGLSGKIMVNILLMVNITPTSYVRDKSVLALPRKVFLPSWVWIRGNTRALIWKTSLLICFKSCQAIPYSHRQGKKTIIESSHFSTFWCIPCTATQEISGPNENINNTFVASRQSFCFSWLRVT